MTGESGGSVSWKCAEAALRALSGWQRPFSMEAPDHGLGPRVQNVTKTFRALLELLVAHQASLPEGFEAG